jgi:tetratricopeptide (TPR) repeat protein
LKGAIEALEDVLALQEDLLVSGLNDGPDCGRSLDNLGSALQSRFERVGSMQDIDRAIELHNAALILTAENDLARSCCLNNLSKALRRRFERTSAMADLVQAISASENAVMLAPREGPDRARHLNNLGGILLERFQFVGSVDALNAAIKAYKDAVNTVAKSDPNKGMYLSDLGNSLHARFNRLRSIQDLDSSIKALEIAVNVTPKNDPNRVSYLANLAVPFNTRFRETLFVDDITVAIELLTEAAEMTAEGDPNQACRLNELGNALLDRAKLIMSKDDLSSSVEAHLKSVSATLENHPHHANHLKQLGMVLEERYAQIELTDDWVAAMDAYERAVKSYHSSSTIRIESAMLGADLYYSQLQVGNHVTQGSLGRVSQMMTTAVELLSTISPRTLERDDRQFALSRLHGLACDAAALSILSGHSAYEAIRLLELGRGVMASVYLEGRSDVAELERAHPDLAKQFILVRDKIDPGHYSRGATSSESASQRITAAQISRQYEAEKHFHAVIESIRAKDHFERFLLGPSCEQSTDLAASGPIVFLNASRFSSDALVITHSGIHRLPLDNLTLLDIEIHAQRLLKTIKNDNVTTRGASNKVLTKTLEWLWDAAVGPVLESLGFTGTPINDEVWPRVWWIPVGRLSVFPIHAAGSSMIGFASDRVISSYTPTLRALDHARVQLSKNMAETVSQTVLLTSMPDTPNRRRLRYAQSEVESLDKLLPRLINRSILQCPTKQNVLSVLRQCSVAHFACHGEANSDPSKSLILFADWESNPLTVADMASENLSHAQMAYISCCHGANNRNFALLDEGIHMAGACQLAGFPTVVATLWQVGDMDSVTVAESLCRVILTPEQLDVRRAAWGLHLAIRKVREKLTCVRGSKIFDDPMTWAPYIHVGV